MDFNRVELIRKLDEWERTVMAVDSVYERLRKLLGATPESDLCIAMYEACDRYTEALMELIGDHDEWLDWYRWENDLGVKQKNAKSSGMKNIKKIKNTADLAQLIITSRR